MVEGEVDVRCRWFVMSCGGVEAPAVTARGGSQEQGNRPGYLPEAISVGPVGERGGHRALAPLYYPERGGAHLIVCGDRAAGVWVVLSVRRLWGACLVPRAVSVCRFVWSGVGGTEELT